MKIIQHFINFISNIFFKLDQRLIYIFVEPKRYPSNITNLKIINNLFYFLKDLKIILLLKETTILIFYNLVNIFKIIYLPLIIVLYIQKKKFIQLNFSQIGVLHEQLNFMIKQNKLNGFDSLILIPKNSKFSYIKNIFLNLKIIDNIFLNIFLIPLKHSSLSSCKSDKIDNFLNENFELKLKAQHSKIYNQYEKNFNNSDIFSLNKDFLNKEEKKFVNENKNLDLEKIIIFHHRENNFNKTSDLRGSQIYTYTEGIEFLLNQNYSIIRLVDKNSTKLKISNKKYTEFDISNPLNQKSQFYLINKSKGFMGTSSGPVSIASLFDVPILETNVYGQRVNAFTNNGSYTLKKVKKKGEILTYDELIKLNFYRGIYYSRQKLLEEGYSIINNTTEEIFKAAEHFDFLLTNPKYEPTLEQKNFKKFLPEYMELKFTKSNIDPNFINLNKRLFQNLI